VITASSKINSADGDSVEKLEANTEESLAPDDGRDIVALPGNQAANREHKHRPKVGTWRDSRGSVGV